MTGRLGAGLLLVAALLPGCTREEAPVVAPPPPEVSIAQPVERTVTEALEYTGRMEAVESVEVRARVSGYITRVAFEAGALVKKGDLLFEIDPREYQAAVNRAEGEIARLRAVLARAVSEVGRTQRLLPSGAASEREAETAIAQKGAAEGELKTALADLEKARLDLQFTRVVAPIAGRVSRAELTVGNLVAVTPSGGPLLTTIVSIDPIWIYFDIDEPSLLRVRDAALRRTGRITAPEKVASLDIAIPFGLVNEIGYPNTATLDFVDNRVDEGTGTMRARAVVRNQNRTFSPGFFVRVKLPVGEPHPAVLVAERAIGTDQDRKYVLVANDRNVVEYRPVRLGPVIDGLRVIEEGLRPGEWVVVNGLQRVRPGVTVTPQRVEMQADIPAAPAPARES